LEPSKSMSSEHNTEGASPCCPPSGGAGKDHATLAPSASTTAIKELPAFADGWVSTPGGDVPRVRTCLDKEDRRGGFKSRMSNFRMAYTVVPGLYAVGEPGPESEVLVSANYKLSFDHLRCELGGLSVWILVLDTEGINVWCAAGKGTFGTGEIIKRVKEAGLSEVVSHRRLVLPQLGAPGVQAHEVKKGCGFRVHYGPVRAADLPAYLGAALEADARMRRVEFPLRDRIVLTPMELIPSLKYFPLYALVVLAAFGLRGQGIMFADSFVAGGPFVVLGFAAAMAGAVLTPALLPWLPFRGFAMKGFLTGLVVTYLFVEFAGARVFENSMPLKALAYAFFPALSSYIALQFTGSTTYTNMSGVQRELRYMLPVYMVALSASLILLAVYKLGQLG